MFGPRSQERHVVSRQGRFAEYLLVSLALGVLTLCWIMDRAPRSLVSAAEPPQDKQAGPAKNEPSEPPHDTRASGFTAIEPPAIEYFPQPTKQDAKIIRALDKPTNVAFLDLALEDCITYLKYYHNINIWLDKQALADQGVAMDQPVTLKAAGLTLKSILKLLLEPVQLTYVVDDGVMKITINGCEKLHTRIYPVRDLYRGRVLCDDGKSDKSKVPGIVAEGSSRGDLEIAIAKHVCPDSWDELSGPGSMTYVSEAGSLVILQTRAVHNEILQFLRDLRESKRVGLGGGRERPAARAAWKLRGPKRAETYSIVGVIDLNGDDNSDAERLRELIKSIGANIDNEVDERGVLRVDGKIPDDGRPRVTEKTKFVVAGKVPQPADLTDADEIHATLKMAEYFKEIEDQASTLSVPVITLEEFLAYIGYERIEGKTE